MIVVLGAANRMGTLARATTHADVFGPGHYASIGGAVALGAHGARAAGWALGGALVVVGAVVARVAREVREPATAPGA